MTKSFSKLVQNAYARFLYNLVTIPTTTLQYARDNHITFLLVEEFIGGTIVLLTIATVISIVIVNFYHKGQSGQRIPSCIRAIVIKYISKIFLVPIPENLKKVLFVIRFISLVSSHSDIKDLLLTC